MREKKEWYRKFTDAYYFSDEADYVTPLLDNSDIIRSLGLPVYEVTRKNFEYDASRYNLIYELYGHQFVDFKMVLNADKRRYKTITKTYPNGDRKVKVFKEIHTQTYKNHDNDYVLETQDLKQELQDLAEEIKGKHDDTLEHKAETASAEANRRAYYRVKEEVFDIAYSNYWNYFVTLTFDGEKVDRYDYDECIKKVSTFFHNLRNRVSKDIRYIALPEHHKNGGIHFHALVYVPKRYHDLLFEQAINRKKNDEDIERCYNIKKWSYGFSTAIECDDSPKMISYVTKYITKETDNMRKGARRFVYSRNCQKPKVEYTQDPCEKVADDMKKMGIEPIWETDNSVGYLVQKSTKHRYHRKGVNDEVSAIDKRPIERGL